MTLNNSTTLTQETTNRSKPLLQKIAELRAVGVGDHISLPQLVVCGDQSAGKSSVLEGITEIPFPRADGVCTKFATEITLTHSNTHSTAEITATIIPHAGRSEEEKSKLLAFKRRLKGYNELPDIIKEVGELMGLRGFGDDNSNNNTSGPAFGEDVLSIHEVSDKGRHLTVVDLPGLIAVSGDDQTEDDVDIVAGLVKRYIESPRTIIAAIIQAGNDTATQKIIKMAQKVDPSGDRTVGVVTKPDLINEGTEGRVVKLSRNEDTIKLKRGYFVVRNPAPKDLKGGTLSAEKRARQEADYFASPRWQQPDSQLNKSRVGMPNLFKYLQEYLEEHIKRELPKVLDDIRRLLKDADKALRPLGPERHEVVDMRAYITDLSLKYRDICKYGIKGTYESFGGSFFKEDETRLRAQIQQFNDQFANNMRLNGAKQKYLTAFADENETSSNQFILPSKEDNTTKLYHEQCSPWLEIAESHLEKVYNYTNSFIQKLFIFITPDEKVQGSLFKEAEESLRTCLDDAKLEMKKLWQDEMTVPMTYNHYYTENVQKARKDELTSILKNILNEATNGHLNSNFAVHTSNIRSHIDLLKTEPNMETQACKDAIISLKAYYKADEHLRRMKVALKTFVDNVCRQVIERHILRDLAELFSPVGIPKYSDEKIKALAAESEESHRKREELKRLKETLESGLKILV
ncbi:hypothetical protein TWF106_001761 [Orbilia oligospora]|uniref:GED domain-containing protein n=1 Tax=Orbilia oligospora TaxID=2813651 RepID=A0A7C8QXF7_ORBOL|nr:hypothetical protein TWF106_001761 [Orbilia oligospora]